METNNLELWDKVGTTGTDTKTKEVSYGSRKFTAIDAYSQIKTATKQWGKYGEKWGFKAVDYNIIEGRIYFIGTFFYPNGIFPILNDQKVGDDASKKVFTDSLTKALSYLGFNADVFMGKFEGNKYTGKKEENKQDIYTITTKDIENWNGKIYGSSVYIDGEKKTISQEQITKLKTHEKFVELPPKK